MNGILSSSPSDSNATADCCVNHKMARVHCAAMEYVETTVICTIEQTISSVIQTCTRFESLTFNHEESNSRGH